MNYRTDKYGNELSVLGFGCMRFTQIRGKLDLEKAEQEIMTAFHGGVNYYDTAYIYHGSEAAVGEIFARNGIRDQVYIATKLPYYLAKNLDAIESLFLEELKRLKTDYVDYYLMHMLNDIQTWERLKSLGIVEWIKEKQRIGAIRQVGFSYHGNTEMFCRVVDAYDWDFCQIQYNYLDEDSQAGRKGLNYAHNKGLPVIIMEPLRGGRLVGQLPETAKQIIEHHSVKHTPAQWAFRWLWNQPEVTCVLSGMNSVEMVEDNLRTASEAQIGELTSEDEVMFSQVVESIHASMKVGCTGCGYCMPCPKGVDIPGTFLCYNRRYSEGKMSALVEYMKLTAMRKTSAAASNCIQCGRCERHCPQHLEIRKHLKDAARELEGPVYKIARKLVEWRKAF